MSDTSPSIYRAHSTNEPHSKVSGGLLPHSHKPPLCRWHGPERNGSERPSAPNNNCTASHVCPIINSQSSLTTGKEVSLFSQIPTYAHFKTLSRIRKDLFSPLNAVITSCAALEDMRSKGLVQPGAAFAGHSLGCPRCCCRYRYSAKFLSRRHRVLSRSDHVARRRA
jgi:hypothetical protein